MLHRSEPPEEIPTAMLHPDTDPSLASHNDTSLNQATYSVHSTRRSLLPLIETDAPQLTRQRDERQAHSSVPMSPSAPRLSPEGKPGDRVAKGQFAERYEYPPPTTQYSRDLRMSMQHFTTYLIESGDRLLRIVRPSDEQVRQLIDAIGGMPEAGSVLLTKFYLGNTERVWGEPVQPNSRAVKLNLQSSTSDHSVISTPVNLDAAFSDIPVNSFAEVFRTPEESTLRCVRDSSYDFELTLSLIHISEPTRR